MNRQGRRKSILNITALTLLSVFLFEQIAWANPSLLIPPAVYYTYDPIGNMTSKEGVTMNYGEEGAGVHAVSSTSSGWKMQYDSDGNMVKKTTESDPQLSESMAEYLQYDDENRLIQTETPQEKSVPLSFHPGWNFFSLPVIPKDPKIAVLFPNFAQEFEQLSRLVVGPKQSATDTFEHYVGHSKFDDFSELEYGVGYQVYCKSSSDISVTIQGKVPTRMLTKELAVGTYLLGATSLERLTVREAFSDSATKFFGPS